MQSYPKKDIDFIFDTWGQGEKRVSQAHPLQFLSPAWPLTPLVCIWLTTALTCMKLQLSQFWWPHPPVKMLCSKIVKNPQTLSKPHSVLLWPSPCSSPERLSFGPELHTYCFLIRRLQTTPQKSVLTGFKGLAIYWRIFTAIQPSKCRPKFNVIINHYGNLLCAHFKEEEN